jgi:hypothetical protein
MGMLRGVQRTTGVSLPASDLALVKVDRTRRWPSTVESTQQVPHWQEIAADEDVQAAFREVGLA